MASWRTDMWKLSHTQQEEEEEVVATEEYLTCHWADTQISSSHSEIFAGPQKPFLDHSCDEKTPDKLHHHQ